MAIDSKRERLFVGCRGDAPLLIVLDSTTGKIVAQVPIGSGTDAAVFDRDRGLVFTSNGEGTITEIRQESADQYRVLGQVKTEPGARTMTLDAKTHRLFLITANRVTLPAAAGQAPRVEVVPGIFHVLVVGTH
jgi:hypothetical protein